MERQVSEKIGEALLSKPTSRKHGLLVDTGAYDNIGGSESSWFKEFTAHLDRLGIKPAIRDIPQISVSGVGAGAATATQAFTFPGAVLDSDGIAQNIMFDTPIVNAARFLPCGDCSLFGSFVL